MSLHSTPPISCYRHVSHSNIDFTAMQCRKNTRTSPLFASHNTQQNLKTLTLMSTVGSPHPSPSIARWNLDRRQLNLLNFVACGTAISAAWLFFSAIPTLLAFKRAAESLEKLLDVTADELPDTMAGIRLSGMEISDLTMELSDLGQNISQGVKNSTRAVRIAEEKLRNLTTTAPSVPMQGQTTTKDENEGPAVARAARNLRKGILNGRAAFGLMITTSGAFRWAFNFLTSHQQKHISV